MADNKFTKVAGLPVPPSNKITFKSGDHVKARVEIVSGDREWPFWRIAEGMKGRVNSLCDGDPEVYFANGVIRGYKASEVVKE